jgi:hypothetical protein
MSVEAYGDRVGDLAGRQAESRQHIEICAREPEVGFLARRDFDDEDTDRALATTIAAKETAYTYTCLATACWAVF